MSATTPQPHKSLLAFFLLAVVLLIPFWVYGAITGLQLSPGLPVAVLGTFCPMLAAIILVYREDKRAGVVALLKRSFDFQRIKAKRWYAPILLIMPIATVLSFWVQRLTGEPVPNPQMVVFQALALCVGCFIGALGEELERRSSNSRGFSVFAMWRANHLCGRLALRQ